MAVEDKYVNADVAAGKKAKAAFAAGALVTTAIEIVAVASADDDDSVYRVLSGVPSNLIPVSITVDHSSITGGTDYDVGLYKVDGGAVVEVDVLADGISLASAGTKDGLGAVALTDRKKTLAELSGQTDPDSAYDIALTGNTVGTAAGTAVVTVTFVQG